MDLPKSMKLQKNSMKKTIAKIVDYYIIQLMDIKLEWLFQVTEITTREHSIFVIFLIKIIKRYDSYMAIYLLNIKKEQEKFKSNLLKYYKKIQNFIQREEVKGDEAEKDVLSQFEQIKKFIFSDYQDSLLLIFLFSEALSHERNYNLSTDGNIDKCQKIILKTLLRNINISKMNNFLWGIKINNNDLNFQ
ncbi:unnamed protein product [Paramecium pentaurelia]|uniref:Uncharacterized protein n=1 Tax=Paramecium pentaurelia TaxID=43138 RepID=A0A8S1Y5T4_9CILI|nr:unnamed protein product [Paramecium pentaurelia]